MRPRGGRAFEEGRRQGTGSDTAQSLYSEHPPPAVWESVLSSQTPCPLSGCSLDAGPERQHCPRHLLDCCHSPCSFEHHDQYGCSLRWLLENTCWRRPPFRHQHESLRTLTDELQLCGPGLSSLLRRKVPTGLGGVTGTLQMLTGAGKDIGPLLGLGAVTSASGPQQGWCLWKVRLPFYNVLLALSLRKTSTHSDTSLFRTVWE